MPALTSPPKTVIEKTSGPCLGPDYNLGRNRGRTTKLGISLARSTPKGGPLIRPQGGKKRSIRVKQQKRARQKAVERGCRPCCHRSPGSRGRQCRGLRQRRGGRRAARN